MPLFAPDLFNVSNQMNRRLFIAKLAAGIGAIALLPPQIGKPAEPEPSTKNAIEKWARLEASFVALPADAGSFLIPPEFDEELINLRGKVRHNLSVPKL